VANSLNRTQSDLLFAVWQWETHTAEHWKPVTVRELAASLGWRENKVYTVVRSIAKVSDTCLKNYRQHPESGIGRPVDSYRLNQDEIVTFPETAFMLLQLTRFPMAMPFRVDRAAFEQAMQEIGINRALVADRIDTNIKVGYIREYPPKYISPDGKIERDRHFIEMLADQFRQIVKTA
jgi:hypothetical protein